MVCLALCSLFATAQKKKEVYKDSEKNVHIPEGPSRFVVQTKIDSAKIIFDSNSIEAFEKVQEAITIAIRMEYRYELAEAYYTLSEFNMKIGEYNSAVLNSSRAREIYSQYSDWDKMYKALIITGKSYSALGNYNEAEDNFKKASSLASKGSKNKAWLEAEYELANIKYIQGKYDRAEKILNHIRGEANARKLHDLVAQIDILLAEIYESRGDFSKAIDHYGNARDNAFQNSNTTVLNESNKRMVENFEGYSDVTTDDFILQSLDEAGTYFEQEKDTLALVENGLQKADFYINSGDYDAAAEALNYSYNLSEISGNLDFQQDASKKLFDVYQQSNKNSEAVIAYQNYVNILDSVNVVNEQKKTKSNQEQLALRNVEKQIDVLERERQLDQQTITLLEKEQGLNEKALKQQRILLYVLGFILIFFLIVSVIVYRNTQAKKRAHQLLYLKSLRAQMNPHFIFNSLNSVNNYISKSNERAANKYLAKFSRLMRQVLEHSQVEFISLGNEIEILQLYIELEHERFKDKFNYTFDVDNSINQEEYSIPPMLVQPFIENAIWHGLRYKQTPGLLNIKFSNAEDHIAISISDNGIGRAKSKELKTTNQKKHNSSGMRNVENRMEMIQAVFKAKIACKIIDLPDDSGTEVQLKLYRISRENEG